SCWRLQGRARWDRSTAFCRERGRSASSRRSGRWSPCSAGAAPDEARADASARGADDYLTVRPLLREVGGAYCMPLDDGGGPGRGGGGRGGPRGGGGPGARGGGAENARVGAVSGPPPSVSASWVMGRGGKKAPASSLRHNPRRLARASASSAPKYSTSRGSV